MVRLSSQLQFLRLKNLQAVVCAGWRRFIAKLERAAVSAHLQVQCMLFERSAFTWEGSAQDREWSHGQLTVDSSAQMLEFARDSSAADEVMGRVSVNLQRVANIAAQSFSSAQLVGSGWYFCAQIDLDSSHLLFRFCSEQDARAVHSCIVSYLLFRTMIAHHRRVQPTSQLVASTSGFHYIKLRSKLLRCINLYQALDSSASRTSTSAAASALLPSVAPQRSRVPNATFSNGAQTSVLVSMLPFCRCARRFCATIHLIHRVAQMDLLRGVWRAHSLTSHNPPPQKRWSVGTARCTPHVA
jgi:hypothetical protein